MRLYHHPMSSNARRVVMTALQLGLKLDLVMVDLGAGAQRKPDYRSINPFSKVPALDDDGFILTESHAIMQYLCDKTAGQTLYPTDIRARADVNRWLFWNAYHFQPAISVLGWENVVKPMIGLGAPDPSELERGEALIAETAAHLDAHLAGKTWVAQDKLTLADLALATPLAMTKPAKLPVSAFANLQAWFGRIQDLEVWKKTAL